MSDGFINCAMTTKYKNNSKGAKHLTNSGVEERRDYSEKYDYNNPSFDPEKSKNNQCLINNQKPGETLNQTVKRMIDESGAKLRNSESIMAVKFIMSIPSDLHNDPEKLKLFAQNATKFLNETEGFKGNVASAILHLDEAQPHIHIIAIPIDRENNKVDFGKFWGGERGKIFDGSDKLHKLHDRVEEVVGKPIGLKRGDGSNTNGLTNKEYKEIVKTVREIPKKTASNKLPSKPLKDGLIPFYSEKQIDYKAYSEKLEKQNKIISENNLILLQRDKKYKENYKKTKNQKRDIAKQQINISEKENKELKKELEKTKKQVPENSFQAEKIRNELKLKEEKELLEIEKRNKLNKENQEKLAQQQKKANDEYLESLKKKESKDPLKPGGMKLQPKNTEK